jgi:FkbM family methyltransferase
MKIRRFLQQLLAKPIFKFSFEEYVHSSRYFSQNGEDVLLRSILGEQGFYLDVGAHDPVIKSNTFLLHMEGWSGINIDPNPIAINRFNSLRPNDQNIKALVSDTYSECTYLHYNEPAVNCIDIYRREIIDSKYRLLRKEKMKTVKLSDILLEADIPDSGIDLLDVDCEGHDLNVLKSNDWDKFRPHFILAEELRSGNTEISDFLTKLSYKKLLSLGNSLLFRNLE